MAVKKTPKKSSKKATAKRSAPKKEVRKKTEEQAELVNASASAEVQEILDRLFSEIEESKESKESKESTEDFHGENRPFDSSVSEPKKYKSRLFTSSLIKERILSSGISIKFTTPVILVLVLVISGFWGRQIVGLLGVPVNPAPFTALYFEDPHVSATGILKGSTLIFGMHNGYPNSKSIKWKVSIADRTYKTGTVELKAFSSQNVKLLVRSGQPGDFLTISNDALKTPISAVISQ